MERRVRRLLAEPVAAPLGERVGAIAASDLPVVDHLQPPALGRVARLTNGRLRSG